MATFKVLRQHHGDKLYSEGDIREAEEQDVAHLVANGVLEPVKAKAEPAARNKAEPAVQNKAKPSK